MRHWALAMLALSACQQGPPGEEIACGPAGSALDEGCTLERAGDKLVVRRPDGAFRRLEQTADGLQSADGVEEVVVVRTTDGLEATVAGWTYRVPPVAEP